MKSSLSRVALCFVFVFVGACGSSAPAPNAAAAKVPFLGIVPIPKAVSAANGTLRIAANTDIVYSGGEGAAAAARYFVELVNEQKLVAVGKPQEGNPDSDAIAFVLGGDSAPEGYVLDISKSGVTITSSTPAGLFYGARHAVAGHDREAAQGVSIDLPAIKITDEPRFAWRGLMLDSARHYQSPEYIKQFIDWMALHKLNTLHWHLTDDQAWRLEIKKYPKLTSRRRVARAGRRRGARRHRLRKTGKPRLYGGFYTQDAGARDRGVRRRASRHRGAGNRDAGPRQRRGRRVSGAGRDPAIRPRPCPRNGASSRRCSTSTRARSPSSRTCSPKSSSCSRASTSTSAATKR